MQISVRDGFSGCRKGWSWYGVMKPGDVNWNMSEMYWGCT